MSQTWCTRAAFCMSPRSPWRTLALSVAVLYLAIFQFLRTSEQPRPPHAKALSALPIALVVPTAALSVVLAPIGYAYLYERDDAGSNTAGKRLLYASYWVCTARPKSIEASFQVLLWLLWNFGAGECENYCVGQSVIFCIVCKSCGGVTLVVLMARRVSVLTSLNWCLWGLAVLQYNAHVLGLSATSASCCAGSKARVRAAKDQPSGCELVCDG